jgi:hypothetical protein
MVLLYNLPVLRDFSTFSELCSEPSGLIEAATATQKLPSLEARTFQSPTAESMVPAVYLLEIIISEMFSK